MSYELTKQQMDIVNYVMTSGGMLLIEASAGCAKTSTAIEVVERINPARGLYTAFNKSIVEDSKEKMSNYNIECRTFHSLAYNYVRPDEVRELSYNDITESIKYKDKSQVLNAIAMFFVSASVDMELFFKRYFIEMEVDLSHLCEKYIYKMIDKEIPSSFGFLLKFYHLALYQGLTEAKYDIIVLDEINDTTSVSLEIFKLIKSPIKLGLGEREQAIYKFLNLACGFTELKGVKTLPLTKSFRCSVNIAKRIEMFMKTNLNPDFEFVGTDGPTKNEGTLYVTATNSAIVGLVYRCITLNQGFKLLRKPSDIFACALALSSASAGKKVYQHKYKYLEKEFANYKSDTRHKGSFHSYLLEVVADDEIESAVSLLASLRDARINVFKLYEDAKKYDGSDPNRIISTAFTCKGLEMKTVHISDDLNAKLSKVLDGKGDLGEQDTADKRLYYVACSRAIENLHNAVHLPKLEDIN